MFTEVTCAHCQAVNTINPPDDFSGELKWECTPCGGISAEILGAEPTQEVVAEAVNVVDADNGGGVEQNV